MVYWLWISWFKRADFVTLIYCWWPTILSFQNWKLCEWRRERRSRGSWWSSPWSWLPWSPQWAWAWAWTRYVI